MNPYTQSLLKDLDDPRLKSFIALWDGFEESAIEIYRGGGCSAEQAEAYHRLIAELRSTYPAWRGELASYWRDARIKGGQLDGDPFLSLLELEVCSAWISNQDTLRLLPAAREAINRYLQELLNRFAE